MFRTIALQYHPDRNSSSEAKRRWEGVPGKNNNMQNIY